MAKDEEGSKKTHKMRARDCKGSNNNSISGSSSKKYVRVKKDRKKTEVRLKSNGYDSPAHVCNGGGKYTRMYRVGLVV